MQPVEPSAPDARNQDGAVKRWARWTLFATTAALALAAAAVTTGELLARHKMQRRVAVAVQPLALPAGAVAADVVARGRYLYASRGCADCHGADGGGRTFLRDNGFHVAGPRIGPGPGSVTAGYGAADWVRTVRHGVKPDGRPALIMPSEDYNRWSDGDLGALVAYLRQMAPPTARWTARRTL